MRVLRAMCNDKVELEVIECDCGYHMGIDASFLLQVGDFVTKCPSCDEVIDTKKIFEGEEWDESFGR